MTSNKVRHTATTNREDEHLSPRVERAIALVASGMAQKDAAAEVGIRADYLSRMINSERGQQRLSHWLRREVTRLAPSAVRALGAILAGKNATAAVRAAETILDRSGLHTEDIRQHIKFETGELNVYLDILPHETAERLSVPGQPAVSPPSRRGAYPPTSNTFRRSTV